LELKMNYFEDEAGPLLLKLGNEVRHTLHHMLGLLELAEAEAPVPLRSRYLSLCKANAEQLLWVANDVSELTIEEAAPRSVRFQFGEMVEDLVKVIKPLADRKGLTFECWIDPSVPDSVVGDREMIQGTLRRVFENSVSLTDAGSVAGLIKAAACEADSVIIEFDVRDTRRSIAKVSPAKDEVASDSARSQALGFLIAHKRACALGGSLRCLPIPEGGFQIRLSLPLTVAADHAGSETDGGPKLGAFPLRLLVAEDSNESFALFQIYVSEEKHLVSRAFDGAQAVEMVKAGEYDMVVMDIDMPVMNGYAATRAIREWETQQGRSRLPIVLLSAEHAARQRGLGAEAGCSGYLTKPALKNVILEALHYYGDSSLEPATGKLIEAGGSQ
jgi:CheY-like chemotaxis protein